MIRTSFSVFAVALFIQLTGCATPFKIRPALMGEKDANVVWWVATDPADLRPPIVGIEHRLSGGDTFQTVFTDRGVRSFRYQGRKLISAGPPLPENAKNVDKRFLRSAFRRNQNWPNRAPADIPPDQTASVQLSTDIARILTDHWPDQKVPPPNLPFRQLNAELEHHAHGIDELLELNKAF